MKIRKLNVRGFSHDLLIVAFVVVFALVGAAYLVATHAQTLCGNPVSGGPASGVSLPASSPVSGSCPVSGVSSPTSAPVPAPWGSYLSVSTTSVNNTLSRGNPNNKSGQPISGAGFVITAKKQVSFELVNNTHAVGVGFATTSGSLKSGQKLTINTSANPSLANKVYIGNYTLKYYDTVTSTWRNGPTIKWTINLVNSYYTDYLTMSYIHPVVTIHRSQKPNAAGLLVVNGPVLQGTQPTSYSFYPHQAAQGVGYYTSSGKLTAKQSLTTQLYVNPNKKNGTYTGTYTLHYTNKAGTLLNGPVVSYSITLAN